MRDARTASLLLHFPAMSPEKLGQHFLTDASWQERIARAIRIDDGVWVEIGAGHGEMTARLAQRASKVIRHRTGPRLASRLREVTAPYTNVEVVESDVLAVDFANADGRRALFRVWKPALLHHFADFASSVRACGPDRCDSHRDSIRSRGADRRAARAAAITDISPWFRSGSAARKLRFGFRRERSGRRPRSLPRW